MNYLTTSEGEKISRSQFDRRILEAKKEKLYNFFDEHNRYFCEVCLSNNCKPIDNSHDVSVKKCIEMGKPELAYDVNNITLRGRDCHNKHDTNYIMKG